MLAVFLLLRHLRLLKFSEQPLTARSSLCPAAGALPSRIFAIKPNAPASSADEIVFASIEELRDAVARVIKQRPVVLSQDRVGK